MPWTAGDAPRHTRKARTAKQRRQWRHVANSMLERGYEEARAIRAANAAVAKSGKGGRKMARRRKRGGRRRGRKRY